MQVSFRPLNQHILVLLLVVSIPATNLFSQITSSTGYTADEIASYLAGDGVIIDNAVMDCHNLAFGKFDCVDCNVGIDSGVILTSGRVINITGPNNSGSTGTANGWPGDPDLEAIPGVGATFDACVLEFDVFSPGDSLKFDYVFGSDEYLEYVNVINDVFAFWISGPGFGSPTNIALIPGTSIPVTINNVNNLDFPMYYINNGTGGGGIYGTDPYYIEYDGFTTVLTAEAEVTPCEWYHLKLAVADQSDNVFDSGVFIRAKSLLTNTLADFAFPGFPLGLFAEFCSTDPDPVPLFPDGAVPGIFTATPAGLVFDPTTGIIDLSASTPGEYEYTNTLITDVCYADTAIYTLNVIISDPVLANFSYPSTSYCINDTDPSPMAAVGAIFGTFSAAPAGLIINATTGVIDLSASTPGTYTITNFVVSGTACPDASNTFVINIYPTFTSIVNASICDGDSYTLPTGTVVFAAGAYTNILNSVHGCDSTITTVLTIDPVYVFTLNPSICTGSSYILPDGTVVSTAGTYFNAFVTAAGCDSNYTINLSVNPTPIITPTVHICDGETYILPDGVAVGTSGVYDVTLVTGAGCDSTISTTVLVHPVFAVTVNAEICDDVNYTLPDGTIVNVTGVYITNLLTTKDCDSIITTNLTVHPTFNTILNPEICIGETYTLPDGAIVSVSGTFNYSYSSVFGCDSFVTVNLTVNPLPVLSWVIDDIFCMEEGFITLTADPAGGIYSGTGTAGDQFVTSLAGVGGPYTLTYDYTDVNGCFNTISVETSVDENYATAWGDTTVYYGEDIILFSDAGGDYTWSPPNGVDCITCPITTILPPYTTDYIITSVDENGCIATDNAFVTVLPDPGNILFVPNTFTPNSDGNNDVFFVFGYNLTLVTKISVFDRWGEMVYLRENISPYDISNGWDGTINGKALNNGVYAYVVEVQFETGQIFSQMGNVTLIR
ncbi:MAG: choice-of-anchor L domain-containing protein [Bacteroidetes bacterium]|jgi:gliding motility-associated-like protein|nr:choice-of-anchor L domain-containing protein [Bacteroidota bacterium]